ncbi:MAG: hypothetical protein H0V92_07860 [Pseudonocardiales bacterium]|nr:hypothetical protein [Pseudonocardiales bacterium]
MANRSRAATFLTLQRILGYTPTHTALALLLLAIGGLICATLAGRPLPRLGAKRLLIGGHLLYIGGHRADGNPQLRVAVLVAPVHRGAGTGDRRVPAGEDAGPSAVSTAQMPWLVATPSAVRTSRVPRSAMAFR